jgi:hypothetical protein
MALCCYEGEMTMYTCDPALELNGSSMHSLLASINRNDFLDILEKNGLAHIDVDKWYPVQQMLNVFNEMDKREGHMMNLVSIGMAVATDPESMRTSTEGTSVVNFVKAYGQRWTTLHRNGDPGTIEVETQDDKHFVLTARVPYPDDLMYGILYGWLRRLKPPNVRFTVRYDESQPRRDQGGDSTVIHIQLS